MYIKWLVNAYFMPERNSSTSFYTPSAFGEHRATSGSVILTCIGRIYDANKWMSNEDSEMTELTSFILIICYELSLIGKFISNICRLFFDKKLSTVQWLILNLCQCVAFCEYILLILYIKWLVNKINDQILKRYSTISTFRDMYLEVIECLNDINSSIYGLSGIVGLIGVNVVQIITILYRYIIFPRNNINNYTFYAFIILSSKIFNVILFYKIGDITEKEINRMSLVLHQRSIIERNPAIKRQIKCFILRRLHERYRFELYGIYQINLRQLLILSNNICVYLFIQILFKLNKLSININK
ncbi:uncharacterized protein LOC132926761 [Rhopalosiphum padi]|uniref:uncharacterized protein LOC132926761 n=1 Tax=Rhopalosiphum padi TaxID=40932 RepID=UPI00298EAFD0|nr:uncharacterized protein LOC132926761 [Rhopalosiphum padi]